MRKGPQEQFCMAQGLSKACCMSVVPIRNEVKLSDEASDVA